MNKIVLLMLFLTGCGIVEPTVKRQSKLSRLDFEQTTTQVRAILGEPSRVRAAGQRKDGKYLRLWEYQIFGDYRALANGLFCPLTLTLSCWVNMEDGTSYWLEFIDGKLERWGRAGDWKPQQIEQDITIHQK